MPPTRARRGMLVQSGKREDKDDKGPLARLLGRDTAVRRKTREDASKGVAGRGYFAPGLLCGR